MLQKYRISIEREENRLTIEEFVVAARVQRDVICSDVNENDFLRTHTETYDSVSIQSSVIEGKNALVAALRTDGFFPIGPYVDAIAESVKILCESEDSDPAEIFFDDRGLIAGN